jgi:alanyl-tRNA synthetase
MKMKEETRRLYFEDPYQVEFEADVLEKVTRKQKPALILDQTCFYPESGGQPCDKGFLNGVEVLKVLEDEPRIVHLVAEDIPARKVTGKIDWQARFDHMQQHSGQHILSQSFHQLLDAKTVAFHMGEAISTLEMDLRKISEKDIENIERRANEIVFEDREIKCYFIPEEKIENVPLRRPPKKKGLIRVVEVSDFDFSACGGTHVHRTGEIGLIKILRLERIRNNIRFEFICGRRALEDYLQKNRTVRELSTRFTVNEGEILSTVKKLSSELKSQKRKRKKLQEKIARYEAQKIIQEAKGNIIKEVFVDKTPEEARFLVISIIRKGDFVVLFGLKGDERGHLILACSENFNIDMREIVPLVSPLIKGKGGGSTSLVEVAGEEKENIEQALEKAFEFIKKKMGPDL